MALAGCSGSHTTPTVMPATNATSAPGLPTTVDALPPTDAAGFDALLGRLHGTPVVVNFWASWCDPCKREAAVLDAAHASDGDAVQFLGVDMQDSRDGAIRFLAEHQVRYPSVFDPANAIGVPLGLFAPPMTIVYDAQGEVAATLRGEVSSEDLRAAIAKVHPATAA
jgi:cytochrome c biogenesis protein CcmG/thiol:disulfide interchange protein DsbE